jgi:hypothetical protein
MKRLDMLKQWLYVLRADELEIYSSKSFYSYTEAQETAKNVAIGMHYKDRKRWSFEVVECDFEPEEINKKEMPVLGLAIGNSTIISETMKNATSIEKSPT